VFCSKHSNSIRSLLNHSIFTVSAKISKLGRLDEKVTIFTGASSGIGKATAYLFAKDGAKAVLVTRRQDEASYITGSALTQDGGLLA
jgi:NADPH:quinone reductase-like Zn-dependent oxidoreductase